MRLSVNKLLFLHESVDYVKGKTKEGRKDEKYEREEGEKVDAMRQNIEIYFDDVNQHDKRKRTVDEKGATIRDEGTQSDTFCCINKLHILVWDYYGDEFLNSRKRSMWLRRFSDSSKCSNFMTSICNCFSFTA